MFGGGCAFGIVLKLSPQKATAVKWRGDDVKHNPCSTKHIIIISRSPQLILNVHISRGFVWDPSIHPPQSTRHPQGKGYRHRNYGFTANKHKLQLRNAFIPTSVFLPTHVVIGLHTRYKRNGYKTSNMGRGYVKCLYLKKVHPLGYC